MRKTSFVLTAIAALSGAAAVALAAAGAHVNADPRLQTAAQILLPHAVAALGFIAHSRSAATPRGFVWAAGLLLAGGVLFAGDMTFRVFVGHPVFPYAAPIGGGVLVAGWLTGVGAAIMSAAAPRPPLPPEPDPGF